MICCRDVILLKSICSRLLPFILLLSAPVSARPILVARVIFIWKGWKNREGMKCMEYGIILYYVCSRSRSG